MDRFLELETFIAIAESGSLSGAARRLNIAVSAVSRRMDELERRLGVRLATRSTRGFALTAAGESYYERSLRLLGDFAEADALVRDEQSELRGLLRIASPLSFGIRYIAPLATRLMAQAPDLRVELDMSDRRIDLVSEGVDLAVRIGSLDDSSLIARKLFDVRHIVAASPDFWKSNGKPAAPDALRDYPVLGYRTSGGTLPWTYRADDGQTRSVNVVPRLLTNNGDTLLLAAKEGLGVLLEPDFICDEALAAGDLEEVLSDYNWIGVSAYVVYPSGQALPARARRMIDLLVDELAN